MMRARTNVACPGGHARTHWSAAEISPANEPTQGLAATQMLGRRLRPPAATWAFTLEVYVLAGLLYLLLVRPHAAASAPSGVPWPLVAAGFALAELKTVNVRFRRDRHGYSLSEVPAVIGLFTLSPADFLLAILVGSVIGLVAETRQVRIRLVFNLGLALLVGVTMVGVFSSLSGLDPGAPLSVPGVRPTAAALAASATASVVGAALVAAVIVLSGAPRAAVRIGSMIEFAAVVALTNASIAVVAVIVLAVAPTGLLLLAVPIATLYFAYRAYLSEREKHTRLELLYESSRILQDSPELDASVMAVLEHTRRMFEAQLSQIVIFQGRLVALATTAVLDGQGSVMAPTRVDSEPPLWQRVRSERRAFFWAPAPGEQIAGHELRQVMVCPLGGEGEPIGMLLVANRSSQGTVFADDDLPLLETVANQVGVALENGQLERSLGELSRLKEQLRHLAFHDALTGLPNRTMFAEQVELRLSGREGEGQPVVLFLDLDDFKNVNDTLGHAIGDRLLVAVADRIRECVRSADIAARLGGDEFAILLDDTARIADALAIGERLAETLRHPFMVDGNEIMVGASVGIAEGRGDILRADELLRDADVAMYTAKSNGKRRLEVFDPHLHAELVARHQLSSELWRSLGRGELLVHYQPIIELASGRMAGVEALVRWRHPVHGFVPPDEFVRLAEENGSIDALGSFVLGEACREVASWRTMLPPDDDFWVSVNASPNQLRQPTFPEDVERAIANAGLAPRNLVLEMTETGMFHDMAATVTALSRLRAVGMRVAMDDFGTGYSSLSFLRRFPVDILKIARDFIAGGDDGPDEADWAFTQAIIDLARTLGLGVVAEGIESEAQLARLVELGCGLGQGFFFDRPQPGEAIRERLAARGMPRDDAAKARRRPIAAASRVRTA
jgi:diguanylate cyclase (GGDEF)-like protein